MSGGLLLLALLSLLLLSNGCRGAPAWGYKINNPAVWPSLSPKWCAFRAQSPIKLAFSEATYDTDLPSYTLTEQNLAGLKYQVYNDGQKVTVVFKSVMSNISIPGHSGSCFRPQSIHWHWGEDNSKGSEHGLDGRQYPMEGHIVMWNCQFYASYAEAADGFGGLAVLGAVYEPDSTSAAIISPGMSSLLSLMSSNPLLQQCAGCSNDSFPPPLVDMAAFSLNDMLPSDRSQYYLYSGSLTTPDCRENVMWTVYRQSIRVPPSVLTAFRSLKFHDGSAMQDNYRPTMPLNPFDPFGSRRMVVRSFNSNSGGSAATLGAVSLRSASLVAYLAFAVAAVISLQMVTPLAR